MCYMDHPKTNSTAGLGTRTVWSGKPSERWAGATQVPVALSVSRGGEAVSAATAYVNMAANLGAVETVAGPPATTSHVESTPE